MQKEHLDRLLEICKEIQEIPGFVAISRDRIQMFPEAFRRLFPDGADETFQHNGGVHSEKYIGGITVVSVELEVPECEN